MSSRQIILLLGAAQNDIQPAIRALQEHGIGVESPSPFLLDASHLMSRQAPGHAALGFSRAIRRYFEDFGLPPIAPIPADRLTPEAAAYYAHLFGRVIGRSVAEGRIVFADFITAICLPLILEGATIADFRIRSFFFFRNPASEIAELKNSSGQPGRLTDYVWRNAAFSSILAFGRSLSLIDLEEPDLDAWKALLSCCEVPPDQWSPLPGLPRTAVSCQVSPTASALYGAMKEHVGTGDSWDGLKKVAFEAAALQADQDGWQYIDCLDCGEMDAHARRLLNLDQRNDAESGNAMEPVPADVDWQTLLDEAERKLMAARDEYEARLFMHTQTLATRYRNALADERALAKQRLSQVKARHLMASKRRKARLRKIIEDYQIHDRTQIIK